MNSIATTWWWFGFSFFLVVAFAIDFVAHPERHALRWTCVWVAVALLFDLLLWQVLPFSIGQTAANQTALDFLTGYLIEKSLSIDNLFAFYLIFNQLKIPNALQHRVFSYGVISAVIMRLGLILIGSWLVADFHWVLYIMGGFLLLMGIKMLLDANCEETNLKENKLFNYLKKWLRVTDELKGQRFFIKKNHLLYATPLLIALFFIELNDLLFALDSIPAIFAITTDPFIVWTSNVFAILGLRALYFVMANMVKRFHLLKYGIALIIIFVGVKILIAPWFKIPVVVSLSVIIGILLLFMLISHLFRIKPNGK